MPAATADTAAIGAQTRTARLKAETGTGRENKGRRLQAEGNAETGTGRKKKGGRSAGLKAETGTGREKQVAPGWSRPRTRAGRLLRAYLAACGSMHTRRAYRGDLATLRRFLGLPGEEHVCEFLIHLPPGDAAELGIEYVYWLRMNGQSRATVARRVAALKSLARVGRQLRLLTWTLDVRCPRPLPLRDTRGPGRAGFLAMLAAARAYGGDAKRSARDVAALRLLHDLALRRAELVGLDLAHVDLGGRRVAVLGKGEDDRRWLRLPLPTVDAVAEWIAHRGPAAGPLLVSLRPGFRLDAPRRLNEGSLYRIIVDLAARAGVRCTPHGLRHAGITAALDAVGGDVRRVQQYSRHRSAETVIRYDDARRDAAGAIAELVADDDPMAAGFAVSA